MDLRAESVVRIHSEEDFIGTGFLVHHSHDAGFVMTCRHVIADEFQSPLRIFFPNGNIFDVAIVKEDESADLALLRYPDSTTTGSPKVLQLAPPPPGGHYVGSVELIAYFSRDDTVPVRPGISTGLIIGEPTISRGQDWISPPCNISNETATGGTSGAPLMSGEEVIGVHNAEGAGIKFSIMAKDIHATLQKWSKGTKDGIAIRDMLTMIATDTATASSSAPKGTTSSSKQ